MQAEMIETNHDVDQILRDKDPLENLNRVSYATHNHWSHPNQTTRLKCHCIFYIDQLLYLIILLDQAQTKHQYLFPPLVLQLAPSTLRYLDGVHRFLYVKI